MIIICYSRRINQEVHAAFGQLVCPSTWTAQNGEIKGEWWSSDIFYPIPQIGQVYMPFVIRRYSYHAWQWHTFSRMVRCRANSFFDAIEPRRMKKLNVPNYFNPRNAKEFLELPTTFWQREQIVFLFFRPYYWIEPKGRRGSPKISVLISNPNSSWICKLHRRLFPSPRLSAFSLETPSVLKLLHITTFIYGIRRRGVP